MDARANGPHNCIFGLRIKSRDNKGDLGSSSVHNDAVVRLKERAATIIAQVDHKMALIKEHNHHWEDRIKVRLGLTRPYQYSPLP